MTVKYDPSPKKAMRPFATLGNMATFLHGGEPCMKYTLYHSNGGSSSTIRLTDGRHMNVEGDTPVHCMDFVISPAKE